MLKRIALMIIASALVFATSGAALAETSIAQTSRPIAGPLTIQRLMQSRIDWTMRLGRLLNGFESASEVYGTQTIVDEPDPTSSRPPGRSSERRS